MFFFYQILVSILLLISPLIIIFRIFKKKEDKKRFLEKFSICKIKKKGQNLIWFHGASIGEILSVIPLIKYYENNKSIDQILITSSTLSSSNVIKKFNFKKTTHQFYPIDHLFFTNKFLNNWKPKLAIFIESEIWPCMFKNLDDKNIPIILLNARLTKKTFNKWKKIKYIANSTFNRISIAYPQNFETQKYLKKLGVKNIKLVGNLKFIENSEESLNKINKKLKSYLKRKKIWIASSTHRGEEILCAKAHLELKNKFKNLITVIIPRHIDRSDEIISEIKYLNLKIVKHSSNTNNLKNTDIYLVDTFGETKKFYNLAPTVFLGGSIINRGGQNPLEAVRTDANILHGPNIDNFKDIYKLLKKLDIAKKVFTVSDISNSLIFKKNKRASIKIKNIGEKILKNTIKEFNNLINDEFKKT